MASKPTTKKPAGAVKAAPIAMTQYVSEAIRFAQSTGCDKDVFDGINERAANLETGATEHLRALKFGRISHRGFVERWARKESPSVGLVADTCWREIGGYEDPKRATAILAAARIEYARSLFHELLNSCFVAVNWPDVKVDHKKMKEEVLLELRSRDWLSADSIARAPWANLHFGQSAAFGFNSWLAGASDGGTCDYQIRKPASKINPVAKEDEVRAAIALSWIDEGLFVSGSGALHLFAEAAEALNDAGFYAGWNGHKKTLSDDLSLARHRSNRDDRAKFDKWLSVNRAKYAKPNMKGKAANDAVRELGLSWKTVRNWLTLIDLSRSS
jgi:hypothetical protein